MCGRLPLVARWFFSPSACAPTPRSVDFLIRTINYFRFLYTGYNVASDAWNKGVVNAVAARKAIC